LTTRVFRKQGQLETLILSGNMLQSLEPEPGIFSDCTNLRNLSLSADKISEISRSTFYGLAQLQHLDLSINYIQELNPHLFRFFSIRTNRHNHQVTKLNTSTWSITTYGFSTSNYISRWAVILTLPIKHSILTT